jgi:hypothetical protein
MPLRHKPEDAKGREDDGGAGPDEGWRYGPGGDTEAHMPLRHGPEIAQEVQERKDDLPAGPEGSARVKFEPKDAVEGSDAEGHTFRGKYGHEDRAEGDEEPKRPADPDDTRNWSDRNLKRDIVPVRW